MKAYKGGKMKRLGNRIIAGAQAEFVNTCGMEMKEVKPEGSLSAAYALNEVAWYVTWSIRRMLRQCTEVCSKSALKFICDSILTILV